MLVLTRKIGEQIYIGDDILVSVIEVDRGGVRLGFEAPRHVSILRKEIYERIQAQNIASARGSAADIEHAARFFQGGGSKE